MTKKDYYKKRHNDCPCCGWQGHVNFNKRKWLTLKKFGPTIKKLFE